MDSGRGKPSACFFSRDVRTNGRVGAKSYDGIHYRPAVHVHEVEGLRTVAALHAIVGND